MPPIQVAWAQRHRGGPPPGARSEAQEGPEHEGSNRTEKATPESLTTAPTLCGLKGPSAPGPQGGRAFRGLLLGHDQHLNRSPEEMSGGCARCMAKILPVVPGPNTVLERVPTVGASSRAVRAIGLRHKRSTGRAQTLSACSEDLRRDVGRTRLRGVRSPASLCPDRKRPDPAQLLDHGSGQEGVPARVRMVPILDEVGGRVTRAQLPLQ